MGFTLTRLVTRPLAPATIAFPTAPRPLTPHFCLPPTNARQSLWARCHAAFCVIPRSRCSFMPDTPLSEVRHRKTAMTHARWPRFDPFMTRSTFSLNRRLSGQSRYLRVMDPGMMPDRTSVEPQWGQWGPSGQSLLSNHALAVSSSGNVLSNPIRVMPSLYDFPGDLWAMRSVDHLLRFGRQKHIM